jgi:hypothetical protein
MMKGAANRFRSGGTNCKIDRGATTSCLSTQFRARVVRVISGNDYSYRRAIKGVAAHGPTRGDAIRRHSHNNQQHGDLSKVRRSWALTPKSRLAMRRVSPSAQPMPIATPTSVILEGLLNVMEKTALLDLLVLRQCLVNAL